MNARRLNEPISAASTAAASLLISRLDCERIEALLDSPVAQSVDTSALRAELDRADVIEPARVPPDVITMNSTARFAIEGSDEVREVTLVYPRDADGSASRVSILAPVGSALLGLRVGDAIRWPVPGGHLGLRVLSIDYQPEAAGEFHR
ncbi:nucleoside diphosphate kinase regulator [Lysobacter rhizosphaerae]